MRRRTFLTYSLAALLPACRFPLGTLHTAGPTMLSFMSISAPFVTTNAVYPARKLFRFGTAHTSRYTGQRDYVALGEPLVMSGILETHSRIIEALSPLGLCEIITTGRGTFDALHELRIHLKDGSGLDTEVTVNRLDDDGISLTQSFVPDLPHTMIFDLASGESVVLSRISGPRLEIEAFGVNAIF